MYHLIHPSPKLKKEFSIRLQKANSKIIDCLNSGRVDAGLMPALFSLISYLWCKRPEDLLNKNKLRCQK